MSQPSQQSIEALIYAETENRLSAMQDPSYRFPARIGKGDVIIIVSCVLLCAALIAGCMTGVIV